MLNRRQKVKVIRGKHKGKIGQVVEFHATYNTLFYIVDLVDPSWRITALPSELRRIR